LVKGVEESVSLRVYLWLSCAATCVQKKQWILCINPFHITFSWEIGNNILRDTIMHSESNNPYSTDISIKNCSDDMA
jgi:hypothetical protein